MYESDFNRFKFLFVSNLVIEFDGSKAIVTMDPYKSLESDIHKDLVGSIGAFIMVIDAWREALSEN